MHASSPLELDAPITWLDKQIVMSGEHQRGSTDVAFDGSARRGEEQDAKEGAISGSVALLCSASLLQHFPFYPQRASAKIRTPLMSKYV